MKSTLHIFLIWLKLNTLTDLAFSPVQISSWNKQKSAQAFPWRRPNWFVKTSLNKKTILCTFSLELRPTNKLHSATPTFECVTSFACTYFTSKKNKICDLMFYYYLFNIFSQSLKLLSWFSNLNLQNKHAKINMQLCEIKPWKLT